MSKQDEIDEKRETILNFIRTWGVIKHPYGSRDAEGCLAMLAELGVVIKVERELPRNPEISPLAELICRNAYQEMLKAGYVVVETLIEEKK